MSLSMARGSLLSNSISLEDYSEFILPYRLGSESLVDWRNDRLRFLSEAKLSKELLQADWKTGAMRINGELATRFTYGANKRSAESMNVNELDIAGKGDCWAMVNFAAYTIRAAGIPVAIDFVPRWGNINGGSHAWNVLIDRNRKEFPFMGSESKTFGYDPLGIYYQKRVPGKVYRKIYSATLSNEMEEAIHREGIPETLTFDRVRDVTDYYVSTGTIEIAGNDFGDHEVAFLGVFSNGGWKPVSQSLRSRSGFKFEKMAVDVMYHPLVYEDGEIFPVGFPLYLSGSDCQVKKLEPKKGETGDIPIEYLNSKAMDEQGVYNKGLSGDEFFAAMDSLNMDFNRSVPRDGQEYLLYYWVGEWRFHSAVRKRASQKLIFVNVPSGCLYRLLQREPGKKERVFSISNGRQLWW